MALTVKFDNIKEPCTVWLATSRGADTVPLGATRTMTVEMQRDLQPERRRMQSKGRAGRVMLTLARADHLQRPFTAGRAAPAG